MKTEHDGFRIAEEDLKQRGPGDFLASAADEENIRQSGGVRFRLAGFCEDSELLAAAAEAATEILQSDAALQEHPLIREQVEKMFAIRRDTIS